MTSDNKATLEALIRRVVLFRDARDWKQFHTPKDMALSLVLEAAEVLENFQWKNGAALEEHLKRSKTALGHELSDVLYWVLLMAHDLAIDLGAAFEDKLRINEEKYPVEQARGRSDKYTELQKA